MFLEGVLEYLVVVLDENEVEEVRDVGLQGEGDICRYFWSR